MKRLLLGVLWGVLVVSAVHAQEGPRHGGGAKLERMQRARKEMELRRTLKVADELGLQESQALAMREVFHHGDDQRIALALSIKAEVDDLKRLGKGNPTLVEVDAKLKRIMELRAQLQKVEGDTLEAASKGLSPSQKARLAVVLGMHDRQMKMMMMRQLARRNGVEAFEAEASELGESMLP